MYINPYTAPLAPLVQIAWETGGETGTRMAIEKIGLGLGLGLRAGAELRASGKGLHASGKGLRASGKGLMAGGGVEVIKHKVNPMYLKSKLNNEVAEAPKIVKQIAHEDKVILGNGGGSHITGLFLEKPVSTGILKPRKLTRVSIFEGKHS